MKPVDHATTNCLLVAPEGVSNEECIPLPVTLGQYEGGRHFVSSFWQPSDEERAAIAAGAPVRFTSWGRTHAPMWLGVDGVEE